MSTGVGEAHGEVLKAVRGPPKRSQPVMGWYLPPVFVYVPLSSVNPPHTMNSVPVHTPASLPRALGAPGSVVATQVFELDTVRGRELNVLVLAQSLRERRLDAHLAAPAELFGGLKPWREVIRIGEIASIASLFGPGHARQGTGST
jgi:hypothetical protein